MKDWRTTFVGLLGGIFAAVGPNLIARARGDKSAPPITAQNIGVGVALAALGVLAQDAAQKQLQSPTPPS